MTALLACRFIRLVAHRAGITASEKLALMVAALCHDIDHPGKRTPQCRRPWTQPLQTHTYMGSDLQACGIMQLCESGTLHLNVEHGVCVLNSKQCIAKIMVS